MEKNDIKKALYKQNLIAEFLCIRKGKAYYSTEISSDGTIVTFEIPDFGVEMEAKLLQRWIM